MKYIVLTDPGHDKPTQSLSYWVAQVVAHIESMKNLGAVHLKGTEASAAGFANSVQKYNPRLILFSGHGSHDSVCGHNNETLVKSNHASTDLLRARIVHALACKAGQALGKDLIALGTIAFVGYKENFRFMHISDKGDDDIASLFLEPAYEVAKSLSSGMTAERAHRRAQKMYARNIRTVLAAGQGDPNVVANLLHDLKHHVILGDGQATI